MREMSVAEQRYEAVRSVIVDGETVKDVAARFGVSRKTVHVWLATYDAGGLEGLADRSHRPAVMSAPDAGGGRGRVGGDAVGA